MPATSVAVMGSTGSVGTQTLEVAAARPEDFDVVALGAARSIDLLIEQVHTFRPSVVAIADPALAATLSERVPSGVEVLAGPQSLADAACSAEIVINGVVGFAGLPVTLAVLEAGLRLGLANKESLIAAGPVVNRAWKNSGAELLPVDSEHCAIHQCLRANDLDERVSRIVLTASGGPFRGWNYDDLSGVTVEDALTHPTWTMGPKVTVDSSTLMNKGLEVIEAHELFGVDYNAIDVVIHPQSMVHSMVTFSDGATIAQLSNPDMRLCMGYALAYPDRLDFPYGAIDWSKVKALEFELPDREMFPCLDLAYAAGRSGETAPAWLNAANEVAVEAFLGGELKWTEIAGVLNASLEAWPGTPAEDLDSVLDADHGARQVARALIESLG